MSPLDDGGKLESNNNNPRKTIEAPLEENVEAPLIVEAGPTGNAQPSMTGASVYHNFKADDAGKSL